MNDLDDKTKKETPECDVDELVSITLIGLNKNHIQMEFNMSLLYKPDVKPDSPFWAGVSIGDVAMVVPAVPFMKAVSLFMEKSKEPMMDECANIIRKLMSNIESELTDEEQAQLDELKKKMVR